MGERNLPRPFGASRLKESNLAMDTFTITEDADQEPGVQMATRVPGVTVGGDTFDRPHSGEDAKSPSYPDGPILMHEPSVHLYLEPKMEEAMKFDVIINVAREVKNPFKEMTLEGEQKRAVLQTLRTPQVDRTYVISLQIQQPRRCHSQQRSKSSRLAQRSLLQQRRNLLSKRNFPNTSMYRGTTTPM